MIPRARTEPRDGPSRSGDSSAGLEPAVVAPLFVAAAALALYRTTLLPSVGLWDTAEFQTVAPVLGVAHPTGYPAYVLLGFAWSTLLRPLVEPAAAMNLLATLCAAVAAGLTVDVVRRLTGRVVLGAAAGGALALTPATWSISTRADPHALHLALVAGMSVLLLAWATVPDRAPGRAGADDRGLLAAVVVVAIAVANHSLMLLLLPGVALFVVATAPGILRRPRLLSGSIAVFVVLVMLLYLELPLRAGPFRASLVYGHPETWDGFVYIVTAEQFRTLVAPPLASLVPAIGATADVFAVQFGPLATLVPVAAVVTAVARPRWALLSIPGSLLTCLFAASYTNADIGRYYLGPIFFGWTWLAIAAAAVLDALASAARSTSRLEPRARLGRVAPAAPTVLAAGLLVLPGIVTLPAERATVDASSDRSADVWLAAALDPQTGFAANAVVLSWWDFSTPLWYAQQVDGRRPDLTVIDDRTRLDEHLGAFTDVIDATLGRRPVYAVRIDPTDFATLEARYVVRTVDLPLGQPVYEVLARRSGA